MKKMSKTKKRILTAIALVLAIALAIGAKYLMDISYYKQTAEAIVINDVDLSTVADGTYTGGFDAKIVAATVSVTVQDGKISAIDLLEHKNGRGEAAESIISEVLDAQSLDVDAVSGATNSSNIILKSIENALRSSDAAE